MTQNEPTRSPEGDGAGGEIDWITAEQSPEFRDLVRKRRRFVVPATIFFLGWYTAFILLAGYAPGFMGESIYEGLTVGYALALTQFLMVWILGGLYLRRADRDFDPLARRAAEKAIEVGASRASREEVAGDAARAPDSEAPAARGGHAERPEVSER